MRLMQNYVPAPTPPAASAEPDLSCGQSLRSSDQKACGLYPVRPQPLPSFSFRRVLGPPPRQMTYTQILDLRSSSEETKPRWAKDPQKEKHK